MTTASPLDDRFFQEILRCSHVGVLSIDADTQIIFANPAIQHFLGYEPSELFGQPLEAIFPEHTRFEEILPNSERMTEVGFEETATVLVDRDGNEVPVVMSGKSIEHDGRAYVTLTIQQKENPVRPDTSSKRDDRGLENQPTSPTPSLFVDPETIELIGANAAAAKLLEYSTSEFADLRLNDLVTSGCRELRSLLQNEEGPGEQLSLELECRTATDTPMTVQPTITRIETVDGPFVSIQLVEGSVKSGTDPNWRLANWSTECADRTALPQLKIENEQDRPVVQDGNDTFEETFGIEIEQVRGDALESLFSILTTEHEEVGSDWIQNLRGESNDIRETDCTCQTVVGARDFRCQALPIHSGGDTNYTRIQLTERRHATDNGDAFQQARSISRAVSNANTVAAVAEIVIDGIESLNTARTAGVWVRDSSVDGLRPVATTGCSGTGSAADDDGFPAPITDETAELSIFRSGTPHLVTNYAARTDIAHPALSVTRRLVVPLGEHGVLTIGVTDEQSVDVQTTEVIHFIAERATAALNRLDRNEQLDRQKLALDTAREGIAILDADLTIRYTNEAFATQYGYDEPQTLSNRPIYDLYGPDQCDQLDKEIMPTVWGNGHWQGEITGLGPTGEPVRHELTVFKLGSDRLSCVIRDVSVGKRREQQLKELHLVARQLMHVRDRTAIATIGTTAVEDILGFDVACVRLYNHDQNELAITACTDAARTLVDSRAAYDLESTLAGRALRHAETIHADSVETRSEEGGTAWPSLHVPIGPYGTLSIVVPGRDSLNDQKIQLIELLALTLETALNATERVQALRTQTMELREQRDQLETLHDLHSLIQEIGVQFDDTTSQETLENAICTTLVESSFFQSAWIGGLDGCQGGVHVRASAGIDRSYSEAIERMPLSKLGHGAVQQALDTKDVEVLRQYHRRDEANTNGEESDPASQAIAAIPIITGNEACEILVVTCADDDVFDEETIRALDALGHMIGFAISATRHRELLCSDEVLELSYTISDPSIVRSRLTTALDCRCQVTRSIPLAEETFISYQVIEQANPDEVLEWAKSTERIERASSTGERDQGFLLQLTAPSPLRTIAGKLGLSLQSLEAEAGQATATFEAPAGTDIRRITNTLQANFDTVELVSKRELDRDVRTTAEVANHLEANLTEKQRATLATAYEAGYYDWPRDVTAEELAEIMEISSSTLHQHLRCGERKLLSVFFEEARPSLER